MSNLNTNLLSDLTQLKNLNFSDNSIKSLSGSLFSSLASLLTIDLSLNQIIDWETSMFNTSSTLDILNLTKNKISTLSDAMIADFSQFREVDLLGNSISCDCHLSSYIHQLDTSNSQLLLRADNCDSPGVWRNKPIVTFSKSVSEADCNTPPNLTAVYVVIPLVIVLVAIAAIGYQFRVYIQYYLFRWRFRKSTASVSLTDGQRYTYDAFVSYSNEDHSFVVRIVNQLENQSPCFKLCVFERDFTAGTVLNECILQNIAVSRKVILIISEHFVRSQWCLWELHLAQHSLLEERRDGLILVVLGKMKTSSLPPTLRFLMKTRIFLEWDTDPSKQRLFWMRLRNALASLPHN